MSHRIVKSWKKILSFCLVISLVLPSVAIAEQLGLDLSSSNQNVVAGSSGTIQVGQNTRTVNASDLITPAEYIALHQVLSGGAQSILLSATGTAVGGSFNLTGLGSQQLSNLVIPQGVTAINNFGVSNLNITGNFSNSGNFYAVSSNQAVSTANIYAGNIFNQAGANISSVINPDISALLGGNNYLANLNLSLFAAQNIMNAGSITSAGSLSMTAGNSIQNIGASAVMQAMANVNLLAGSGNIVNSGIIQSAMANINVASLLQNNIIVNNTAGQLLAQNGSINIRDALFNDKANLAILGGDIFCQELNAYSGKGLINISVNDLNGVVNVYGHEAHVTASTNSLQLGNISLGGDPTFYNTAGDIVINTDLIFSGAPIAVIASGNIITAEGAGQINTSSSSGNAGNITMVAGAAFTPDSQVVSTDPWSPVRLRIDGASATGGSIDLTGSHPITSLSATSSAPNGNGGNITLVAFAGSLPDSGNIKLPENLTVRSGGNGTGTNGNVTVMNVLQMWEFTTMQIGSIDTTGGSGGGGNIGVHAGLMPDYWMGGGVGTGLIVNGEIQNAESFLPFSSYSVTAGVYDYNGTLTAHNFVAPGAIVNVRAASLVMDNIVSNGVNAANGGTVMVGTTDVLAIGNETSASRINSIQANAGANGGSGGSILLKTGGTNIDSWNNLQANASQGNGGSIQLFSYFADVNIPDSPLSLNAIGGNYNGGNLEIQAGQLLINGSNNLHISADASGNGNGGSIVITTWGNDRDITIGNNSGQISLSAQGGSVNSNQGNGGNIALSIVGDLTINPNAIAVGPRGNNGNGGTVDFESGNGNLFINDTLNVSGVGNGNGNGGSITLTSYSTAAFVVGSSATNNGIKGSLIANAGANSGNGGSITLRNFGNSPTSTTIASNDLLSVQAPNGNGGELEIVVSNGTLFLSTGTISADAGSGSYNGGRVFLYGNKIMVSGTGTLLLSANASGEGNGGQVSITTRNSTAPVVIGNNSGEIQVTAKGGSTGSNAGNGGSLTVDSYGQLTVDPNAITIAPSGVNGNGANFTINSKGIITINGSLNANGVGIGNGGNIEIISNDTGTFTVGYLFGSNGISGGLSANSGLVSGSAGSITISIPRGELVLSDNSQLSLVAANGNGGSLDIQAAILSLPFVFTMAVNGTGSSSNGGSINISATQILDLSGILRLFANGSGNGDGGQISISANSNVTVGHGSGQVQATATGGSIGSSSGNGGRVIISVQNNRNLNVNPNDINVRALGQNGNGGTINLAVARGNLFIGGSLIANGVGNGSGGLIRLSVGIPGSTENTNFGNLSVNGSLEANGSGTGDGGAVIVNTYNNSGIQIGGGSGQGINGHISANSGQNSGDGGNLAIGASQGDITILNTLNNISVNAVDGRGGTISLTTARNINLPAGVLSANAAGSGNNNGGQITLMASIITITNGGNLALSANATEGGFGGAITLYNRNSNLTIGSGANQISINATGSSSYIYIWTNANLTVNMNSLIAVPSQIYGGSGADYQLTAGGNLVINGSIHADGVGPEPAWAGTVRLYYNQNSQINSPFVIGGTIISSGVTGSVTANGTIMTDMIGQIAFVGPSSSPARFVVNSLVSAIAPNNQNGRIEFYSGAGGNVDISGSGSVIGKLATYFGGANSSVNINLPNQIEPVTLDIINSGNITVTANSIFVPVGSTVDAVNNIIFNTSLLNNNGNIITESITGSLTVHGTGALTVIGSGVLQSNTINLVSDIGVVNGYQGGVIGNVNSPSGSTTNFGVAPTLTTAGLITLATLNGMNGSNVFALLNNLNGAMFVNFPTNNRGMTLAQSVESDSFSNTKGNHKSNDIVQIVSDSQRNLVLFTTANQVFMGPIGGNDDTVAIGEEDTIISNNKDYIILHKGKLTLDNGKKPLRVITKAGQATIAAESTAVVEQESGKCVSIKAIGGNGTDPAVSFDSEEGSASIKPGEELLVGSSELTEEELVAVDGSDNKTVNGTISFAHNHMRKNKFSLQEFADKELMVAGHSIRLGSTHKDRLEKHLASAAQHQVNDTNKIASDKTDNSSTISNPFNSMEFDTVPIVHSLKSLPSISSNASPQRLMAATGTELNFTSSGEIALNQGSLFISTSGRTIIKTKLAKVEAIANAMMAVDSQGDCVKIRACSGPGHVKVDIKGQKTELMPGQELVLISNNHLAATSKVFQDGIGRRQAKQYQMDKNLTAILDEFSMISMLNCSEHLSALKNPDREDNKAIQEQLLKVAAVLSVVTGKRGNYQTPAPPIAYFKK